MKCTFLVLRHEHKSGGLVQVSGNELCIYVKVLRGQLKVLRGIGKGVEMASAGTRAGTSFGKLWTVQQRMKLIHTTYDQFKN